MEQRRLSELDVALAAFKSMQLGDDIYDAMQDADSALRELGYQGLANEYMNMVEYGQPGGFDLWKGIPFLHEIEHLYLVEPKPEDRGQSAYIWALSAVGAASKAGYAVTAGHLGYPDHIVKPISRQKAKVVETLTNEMICEIVAAGDSRMSSREDEYTNV